MQKEFHHPSIPTKISEKIIYDTYCDNYDSIHYLFVEFQFSWLQQAYKALKDIDKYYILIYLYKENFTELNEIFKVKSYEEFYFNPRFELDKINIIQIAKKLRLSKETARRKILELEEDGILIKNKKSIAVTLKAGLLQKPVNTINSFSKILQYVSKLLYDNKTVKKYYEKDFFIKKIKERFTQILAIFLEYQIEYLLTRKTLVNNDIEMWFIYGSVLYNQIMYLKKSEVHKTNYLAELVCSNSFRSDDHNKSAVGLLHDEMRKLGSLVMECGDLNRVPAGSSMSVDRVNFSKSIEGKIKNNPLIKIVREEVKYIPENWKKTISENVTALQSGPNKVHLSMKQYRVNTMNQNYNIFDTLWIFILENGRWGVKFRSSYLSASSEVINSVSSD